MKLYIIPTPVGNLEDITLRAIRVLKEVDMILAEDTRTSSVLLKHLGIVKPLRAFHAFNEHRALESIISFLKEGHIAGLISDAGTPGISDPAFLLIRECVKENIPVECLPGPTAFVPALVQSGLPCDRFTFYGFLPPKKGRKTMMEKMLSEDRTSVLYESPHRLARTLDELCVVFGPERKACVCREISKMHEETVRGTLGSICSHFGEKNIKGEIVVIIGPSEKRKTAHEEDE